MSDSDVPSLKRREKSARFSDVIEDDGPSPRAGLSAAAADKKSNQKERDPLRPTKAQSWTKMSQWLGLPLDPHCTALRKLVAQNFIDRPFNDWLEDKIGPSRAKAKAKADGKQPPHLSWEGTIRALIQLDKAGSRKICSWYPDKSSFDDKEYHAWVVWTIYESMKIERASPFFKKNYDEDYMFPRVWDLVLFLRWLSTDSQKGKVESREQKKEEKRKEQEAQAAREAAAAVAAASAPTTPRGRPKPRARATSTTDSASSSKKKRAKSSKGADIPSQDGHDSEDVYAPASSQTRKRRRLTTIMQENAEDETLQTLEGTTIDDDTDDEQ